MSTLLIFGLYAILSTQKPNPSTTDTATWVKVCLDS